MGITVAGYTGTQLKLSAPLTENINHQQSAFGGSLFSVAALAGWGLLQLKFTELGLDCNTVIATGEVSYRRPVYSDFECRCELPGNWNEFIDKLKANGRASLTLSPQIIVDRQPAMILDGKYVASKRQAESA